MVSEFHGAAADRERGVELARTAEALLAEAGLDEIDPAHAVQLATANALLALYWEMRQQRSGGPSGDDGRRRGAAAATRCGPNRRRLATEPGG